ncbi:hypothetical protein [Actinoplanes solisilvae]|uniref:hypothetical protein n=1 Tax=Actinoplanes solisilvae TaxID=2486853 RepID=UPI000FD9C2CB|nr:hypothetical protein [Actinoplanes solisilvae]
MRKLTKRSAAVVVGSVLAITGGTAAFAYVQGWFRGTSTTYAATSTIGDLTAVIDVRTGSANNFYPGKIVELHNVTVNNPNDYKVKILEVTSVAVTGGGDCDQTKAGFSFPELNTTTVFNSGANPAIDLGDLKMSTDADPVCAAKGGLTVTATLKGDIAP